jgi:peptidyl-tRNA hydrolase, PTH1 family
MVADEVAQRFGVATWRKKDFAYQAHVAARRVVLVKPLSYMNESGYPVRKIAAWWKTPRPEILVVSDDLDLPFGKLRMRGGGGSGGHNGLKSMIAELGGDDFPRLRIGIGRGPDAIHHVLDEFAADERAEVEEIVAVAADGVIAWLDAGLLAATQLVNSWKRQPPDER